MIKKLLIRKLESQFLGFSTDFQALLTKNDKILGVRDKNLNLKFKLKIEI